MRPTRTARLRADRRPDTIAIGVPPLALADEDREPLEDLVADLLVAALEGRPLDTHGEPAG